MNRDVFEKVLSENWEKVARQRYHYINSELTGEDAAQDAAELMLRQFNEGQFDDYTELELTNRFYALARRRNLRQFEKQQRRIGYETKFEQSDVVLDSDQISLENREVFELAYGPDMWIAESLMAGFSLNETAKRAGKGATSVKQRQLKAAKRVAEVLNV